MELVPVQDHKHLVRDLESGAILNTDLKVAEGLRLAKKNRQKTKDQLEINTNDINSIKTEISEIKTMVLFSLTLIVQFIMMKRQRTIYTYTMKGQ